MMEALQFAIKWGLISAGAGIILTALGAIWTFQDDYRNSYNRGPAIGLSVLIPLQVGFVTFWSVGVPAFLIRFAFFQ